MPMVIEISPFDDFGSSPNLKKKLRGKSSTANVEKENAAADSRFNKQISPEKKRKSDDKENKIDTE